MYRLTLVAAFGVGFAASAARVLQIEDRDGMLRSYSAPPLTTVVGAEDVQTHMNAYLASKRGREVRAPQFYKVTERAKYRGNGTLQFKALKKIDQFPVVKWDGFTDENGDNERMVTDIEHHGVLGHVAGRKPAKMMRKVQSQQFLVLRTNAKHFYEPSFYLEWVHADVLERIDADTLENDTDKMQGKVMTLTKFDFGAAPFPRPLQLKSNAQQRTERAKRRAAVAVDTDEKDPENRQNVMAVGAKAIYRPQRYGMQGVDETVDPVNVTIRGHGIKIVNDRKIVRTYKCKVDDTGDVFTLPASELEEQ